jgi:hypothetical protein
MHKIIIAKSNFFVTVNDGRGTIKEPATALQVTGEEGSLEAIEYFTGGYAFFCI